MKHRISDLLHCAGMEVEVTVEPTADAGLAMVATNNFHAILFEIAHANTAALFQITSLTTKAPRQPVIVIGPSEDEQFLAEAVFSGAQDYLGRDQLPAQTLRHAIYCSIARQQERVELVEEKNNYYGLFDHLVEGIFRTTVDGHYLLANIALARIYGYDSPVELMASIKDIAGRLYVEHGRREEFIRLMQENDTLSGFESRIFRKDGTIIWISENCRAVRDGQGKLLYYEGTVEDITRQRQMEEALRSSESLYHSLVETMPQGVFRRDLQGRFTFANQPYCKFHKIKPEEIVGKTDFDFFPKAAAEKYWHDDLRIMEKGETMEILEEAQTTGMAEKQYHHVIKTPLRDEAGRVIGLQGMIWDVTEKIRAEEKIRQTTAELARSREELHSKLDRRRSAQERKIVWRRATRVACGQAKSAWWHVSTGIEGTGGARSEETSMSMTESKSVNDERAALAGGLGGMDGGGDEDGARGPGCEAQGEWSGQKTSSSVPGRGRTDRWRQPRPERWTGREGPRDRGWHR